MSVTKNLFAIAAVAALGACGQQGGSGLLSQATQLVTGTSAPPAPRQAASVSEEELLSNPGKYIRVNIRELGAWDTLIAAGTNGNRTTWLGGLGTSVTLEDGVVVATRGLPRDLMGADAAQTVAAIRNGGGTSVRTHDFLTNQDQITQYTLECTIEVKGAEQVNRLGTSIPAVRFEELCRSEGLTLTNVYWMDASRRIVRSLQAVSPDAGYLQVDAF